MRCKSRLRLICRGAAFVALFALGGLYKAVNEYNGGFAKGEIAEGGDGGVSSLVEISLAQKISPAVGRELLGCGSKDSEEANDAKFPRALASGDEWMIVFLIPAILYTFLALAIICDEYFVPALEVICDEDNLNLSDDVAGATFMAAGGSAPELFTSFIGTMQDSAVGFGTIVGSAVFNVLFVIAMCAFFSKELLTLTWWPLARDSCYYTISLVTLAIFFGVISPNQIDGWEAAVLFVMYFGYVVLMMYNERLYEWLGFSDDNDDEVGNKQDDARDKKHMRGFRSGIVSLVLQGQNPLNSQAAVHIVTKIEGDAEETFNRLKSDDASGIHVADLRIMFEEMDVHATDEQVDEVRKELDLNGDGVICWDEFKEWYNKSEDRVRDEMKRAFDKISRVSMMEDPDCIDLQGLRAVLKEIGGMKDMSEDDFETALDLAMVQIDTNEDGLIQRDEFYAWYETSMFWSLKNQNIGDGVEQLEVEADGEEEWVDPLMWPADESAAIKVFWCISLPLNLVLTYTVPNCANEGSTFYGAAVEKLAWPGFVLSIVWIGIFSYGMVEAATIVGDTASIPAQVMGLTFLAAGTSVPDLLSSIVVAQQGKGDMAVSSSIGSNIFDVLVGLPLPWLSYNIIMWKPVTVGAKSLQVSILILVGMLVSVIVIIKVSGWAMTRSLGIMMLVMYFVFVIQDLLRDETLICDCGCF